MAGLVQTPQTFLQFGKRKNELPAAPPFERSPTPPSDDERSIRRDSGYDDGEERTMSVEKQSPKRNEAKSKLRDDVILAPFSYIKSLPSKGVRELLIEALNVWFQVSSNSLETIKNVVDYLHTSSLMFDDIEDNSVLRRGRPATHIVFGTGQTINSATYILMSAVSEAQKLLSTDAPRIVVDGVAEMLLGQSIDLSTTRLMQCPSEEDYMAMIDSKTGCLFQIAARLMQAESRCASQVDLRHLLNLFGRYFQIRDDYMNLMSNEYAGQKGFCEDLDEGKFSLPLIHCLNSDVLATSSGISPKLELHNIFVSRTQSPTHTIPYEMKVRILEILRDTGSLDSVKSVLVEMSSEVVQELFRLEQACGRENQILRKLTEKLKV